MEWLKFALHMVAWGHPSAKISWNGQKNIIVYLLW